MVSDRWHHPRLGRRIVRVRPPQFKNVLRFHAKAPSSRKDAKKAKILAFFALFAPWRETLLDNWQKSQLKSAALQVPDTTHTRVFRVMAFTTAFTVAVSLFVWPWRVTTGLLVGGLLALFSHSWLKNSAAAAIHLATADGQPQLRLAQFVLRYVVIAAIVFALNTLDLISLPAVLIGLSSFVVAIFFEASREFYFAIIEREEN